MNRQLGVGFGLNKERTSALVMTVLVLLCSFAITPNVSVSFSENLGQSQADQCKELTFGRCSVERPQKDDLETSRRVVGIWHS